MPEDQDLASDESSPWTTLDSREVYDNAWIRVREDRVLRPDGAPGIYGVVHFKNKAVGVVPVDSDGSIWLVGQYRYPLSQYSWEIPEGGCPEGESPEACALRELVEETGLVAGKLEPMVYMHLSNSVSDEWGVVYRATELTAGPSQPDGSERIEVRRVPFEQALAMVERGEITDSMSVAGILREAVLRVTDGRIARTHTISILPTPLAIVRLDTDASIPVWASGPALFSMTRTSEELSLIVHDAVVPAECAASRGWMALKVEGALDLSETGILAALATTLADAKVPIFAISTYDTDYILVRSVDRAVAIEALTRRGHTVRGD